jgi:hypothetical protein
MVGDSALVPPAGLAILPGQAGRGVPGRLKEEAGMRHRRLGERIACLVLAALLACNAGCLVAAAAGVAAGGATAAYFYYRGALYREYPANLTDSISAVRVSLQELRFPLEKEESGAGEMHFTSRTADGSTVRIHVETVPNQVPVEAPGTRISVRVGLTGDEEVSKRILDQISAHLVAPSVLPPPGAQTRLSPIPAPPPVPARLGAPVPETIAPPLAPALPPAPIPAAPPTPLGTPARQQ